jgi:hypothetical protein
MKEATLAEVRGRINGRNGAVVYKKKLTCNVSVSLLCLWSQGGDLLNQISNKTLTHQNNGTSESGT